MAKKDIQTQRVSTAPETSKPVKVLEEKVFNFSTKLENLLLNAGFAFDKSILNGELKYIIVNGDYTNEDRNFRFGSMKPPFVIGSSTKSIAIDLKIPEEIIETSL